MTTIRIEVPVLLYADIRLSDAAAAAISDEDGFTEAGKRHVFQHLEYALGAVGEEPPEPACTVELPRFTDARLYLTDHLFPVHSWDSLSLTSQEGDTPHAND